MMVESRDHRLLSFLCVSGRRPRRCCSASSANPFPVPHLASAAPLVIARLLIQHLPSPTLFGRRARTLPRQARSASHLSRSLLIMGLGMKGCIWVHWPILLGKLAISVGTCRYIGVGQRCSTNAHNQWLMEIKPISMAMVAAWVRSEAPYAGASSLDKEEPRTPTTRSSRVLHPTFSRRLSHKQNIT